MMLPTIMVAPNGARKLKSDHENLPVTLEEIVQTAIECEHAGADGLHLHIRDKEGKHLLDEQVYRKTVSEIKNAVPNMIVQVTTEACGLYSPQQQRELVRKLQPAHVSISTAELWRDQNVQTNRHFYHDCFQSGIAVQHILYGDNDLQLFKRFLDENIIPNESLLMLFVLGRYTHNMQSETAQLLPFLSWLDVNLIKADWAVCAFGQSETACLKFGWEKGGKIRVGFENSLLHEDGTRARSNAERVSEVLTKIKADS